MNIFHICVYMYMYIDIDIDAKTSLVPLDCVLLIS